MNYPPAGERAHRNTREYVSAVAHDSDRPHRIIVDRHVRGILMTGGGLSVRARQVVEHVRGSDVDPYSTSLSGIQGILAALASPASVPAEVAAVIVDELTAAGFISSRDGQRFTVRRHSDGGNAGHAYAELDELGAQLDRILSPTHSQLERLASRSAPPHGGVDRLRDWADEHGLRAQTWLAVAWEHGWIEHAVRLSAGLGRMWTLLGEWDNAVAALDVGQDAANAAHSQRVADLSMCRAQACDSAGRFDEAAAAATSAVGRALEVGTLDLVAAAYLLRADIYDRSGHLADAARDLSAAAHHARHAVDRAPLGDRSRVDVDPDQVAARLHATIRRLDTAAMSWAWSWDPSAEEGRLLATANVAESVLSTAGQSDPAGVQVARLTWRATSVLPDAEAARIATTLGNAAQIAGQPDVAATYFDLAIERYARLGRPADADAVRALWRQSTPPPDGHGTDAGGQP